MFHSKSYLFNSCVCQTQANIFFINPELERYWSHVHRALYINYLLQTVCIVMEIMPSKYNEFPWVNFQGVKVLHILHIHTPGLKIVKHSTRTYLLCRLSRPSKSSRDLIFQRKRHIMKQNRFNNFNQYVYLHYLTETLGFGLSVDVIELVERKNSPIYFIKSCKPCILRIYNYFVNISP